MTELRLAVVQREAGAVEPDQAARSMARTLAGLAGGTDVAVFPELALTGYVVDSSLEERAGPADQEHLSLVADAARRAEITAVVGFPERAGGALHNAAAVIDSDGSLAGVYRKTHLFGAEREVFTPGDALVPVTTRHGVLGVLVCYDLEFPEAARALALAGAEVLVVPTANMQPYGDQHDCYMRSRASENGIPLAVANYAGVDPTFRYLGASAIVTGRGEVVRRAPKEGAVVLRAAVDLESPGLRDPELDYLRRRRTDLYGSP
jgi:predicted amidohydrolase